MKIIRFFPHSRYTLTLFLIFIGQVVYSQQMELMKKFWYPKGGVSSIVHDSIRQRIYLSGDFRSIGPISPNGAVVGQSNFIPDSRYPSPDQNVKCAIPDGNNGWFIGGWFKNVGDSARGRLAHLNSDGELSPLFSGYGFNQEVSSLMLKDSILYIGGNFQSYGRLRSNQSTFDTSGMNIDFTFPVADAVFSRVISDNRKGWFVTGRFTRIGDSLRGGLAHIDSNGAIYAWNPGTNGDVTTMLLSGDTLYLGGNFTKINGISRNMMAAVNASSGKVLAFNPTIQSGTTFSKFLIRNNILYVGGNFTAIAGITRSSLAAIDVNTSKATTWAPKIVGALNDMLIIRNTMYFGGFISKVDGQVRSHLGAVSLSGTGAGTSWNPLADQQVNGLQLYKGTIIAHGGFTKIGSTTRNWIAAIDTSTGLASSWNPVFSDGLSGILLDGDRLLTYGSFKKVSGVYRQNFAILNLATGTLDTAKVFLPNTIRTMALSGKKLFINWNIGEIGHINRNGLAAINIRTGKLTSWDPEVSGLCRVFGIQNVSGPKVIIAGSFGGIGGKSRNNIARLSTITAKADAWNPSSSGIIYSLQLYKGALYVAGRFSTIGGKSRDFIAALDTVSGLATSWNAPSPGNTVRQLMIVDSTVYIVGKFTSISSDNSFKYLAALHARTGALIKTWAPSPPSEMFCLGYKNNKIYAGGPNFCLEVDKTSGRFTYLYEHPNDSTQVISAGDTNMYVGGNFPSIGRQKRSYFATLDAVSGQLLSFGKDLSFNNTVSCMMLKDSTLYMGGAFTKSGTTDRYNLAAINVNSGQLLPWAPSPFVNGQVNSISALQIIDTMVYIGGKFQGMNGISRMNLAAVHAITGKTGDWNPGADLPVNCMAKRDTTLYIGGQFTTIAGKTKRGLAAISINNRLLPWNPVVTGSVYGMRRDGNRLYIGGTFLTVNNKNRTLAADLDLDSGTLGSFDYKLTGSGVYALLPKDSQIYMAGSYTLSGTPGISYLAAVGQSGSKASSWNPMANTVCSRLESRNNLILTGGSFDNIAGQRIQGFAVFRTPCPEPTYGQVNSNTCGKFTMNGITYFKSGSYRQKVENYRGCDSIITLNLNIADSSANIMKVSSCNSAYTLNGITYTSSGKYYQRFKNVLGCDSILTIDLVVANTTITYKLVACKSVKTNGTIYDSTGFYTQKLTSIYGCDSFLNLDITIVQPSDTFTLQAATCNTFSLNGKVYNVSGTYYQKLRNYQSCDSTIRLNLKVIAPDTQKIMVSACRSYTVAGKTFSASGNYTVKTKGYLGCDSTILLQLTILSKLATTLNLSDCNSVTVNGFTYTNPGSYVQTLVSHLGCDSLLTINFTKDSVNTKVEQKGNLLTAQQAGAAYQWVDCNNAFIHLPGETQQSFRASKPGTYAVSVFYDSCYGLSTCYNITSVDVQVVGYGRQARIYPNPAGNTLNIEFMQDVQDVPYQLTDMTGKVVLASRFSGTEHRVDLSSVTPGVYILSMQVDGAWMNFQVLKGAE
jgi:hypothetical protein